MKIALAIFILLSFALHGSAHKDDPEQELRNLVATWDNAYVKSDTETLGRLLADEFEFVGGAKKADYLASFKTRKWKVQSAVSSDLKVQIYADMAIVTGLDTITIEDADQNQVTKWLYLDVWIKRGGRWQCVKTYSAPLQNRER
jgi:ketosteroid isomerase-like protein